MKIYKKINYKKTFKGCVFASKGLDEDSDKMNL